MYLALYLKGNVKQIEIKTKQNKLNAAYESSTLNKGIC